MIERSLIEKNLTLQGLHVPCNSFDVDWNVSLTATVEKNARLKEARVIGNFNSDSDLTGWRKNEKALKGVDEQARIFIRIARNLILLDISEDIKMYVLSSSMFGVFRDNHEIVSACQAVMMDRSKLGRLKSPFLFSCGEVVNRVFWLLASTDKEDCDL